MKEYAINVVDLIKDMFLAEWLVSPIVQNRIIVNAEEGVIDGGAIVLECDEKRAKGIVDVIRIKYHKNELRCYERNSNGKTWKRI